MDKAPKEVENLIYRYEHGIKFHKVLDELKKVEHKIQKSYFKNYSELSYGKKYCQYYPAYSLEDYTFRVIKCKEKFEHVELETFGKGWQKLDNKGKIIFKSDIY